MILYEIKIKYERQTGEENPKGVKEVYLVEGLSCSDVEQRVIEEIKPLIFGEYEVQHCKKVQYFDIFPNEGGEYWYKGRVEMITIDGDKETRRTVSVLVQANTLDDGLFALRQSLNSYDCEVISIAKSPVVDMLHAISAQNE